VLLRGEKILMLSICLLAAGVPDVIDPQPAFSQTPREPRGEASLACAYAYGKQIAGLLIAEYLGTARWRSSTDRSEAPL
jgi:hypothetical protein